MKTFSKIVMLSSAVLNGVLGIVITFLPQETGRFLGTASQAGPDVLVMQILGGTLFGFGVLNYMSRNATLGGIYGKPILLANMVVHFIAGLELAKYLFDSDSWNFLLVPAILYSLLALGFIKLNFTSAI